MTTIAYRDGVMAADSALTYGDGGMTIIGVEKLVRGPEGQLAGACGELGSMQSFLDWVTLGCEGELPEGVDGILVRPDGKVFVTADEKKLVRVTVDFIAIGGGAQVAMGAMWAGASAARAVWAACELSQGTTAPVRTLELRPE